MKTFCIISSIFVALTHEANGVDLRQTDGTQPETSQVAEASNVEAILANLRTQMAIRGGFQFYDEILGYDLTESNFKQALEQAGIYDVSDQDLSTLFACINVEITNKTDVAEFIDDVEWLNAMINLEC